MRINNILNAKRSYDGRQVHGVPGEGWEIIHKDKVHRTGRTINKKYDWHRQQDAGEDTWLSTNSLKCGRVTALNQHHEQELGNCNGSYYGRNNISLTTKWEISSQTIPPSAISKASNKVIRTLLSPGSFLNNYSDIRIFIVSSTYNNIMARERSWNASTNQDLKKAREAYETRTTQKEKRKIKEFKVAVTEEEEQLDVQVLETEIHWISDPGTTTTRATQFV